MLNDKTNTKIQIGVSSCLLGNAVRYDGGHKRDWFIDRTLGRYFDLLPLCPKMEIGLGIPREPIQLVNFTNGAIHAVEISNPESDVTEKLESFGRETVPKLAGIRGYIFKSKSPSCGIEHVKVNTRKGMPTRKGRGIFAAMVMDYYPLLPVEEEGRLTDPGLRENFIERVFVYERWLKMMDNGFTVGKLVDFHESHKLLIMSHSQAGYKRLGQLVVNAYLDGLQKIAEVYGKELMISLKRLATNKSHHKVLQHLLACLKKVLDPEEKKEMLELIEKYKQGLLPLIAPVTLLKNYLNRHPRSHPYTKRQFYLDPDPQELMLRNKLYPTAKEVPGLLETPFLNFVQIP